MSPSGTIFFLHRASQREWLGGYERLFSVMAVRAGRGFRGQDHRKIDREHDGFSGIGAPQAGFPPGAGLLLCFVLSG